MSKQHGAREQKKLTKQKAKQEARRRGLARRNSPDPNIRLKGADRWPIVATLVPENLWTMGIGNLVIARRTPDGQIACAVFLVDVYCLGVKNAFWSIADQIVFRAQRQQIDAHGRLMDVSPEYFAKLLYRAADFGQSLGFPPHRDFHHSQRLLAGIDPSLCPDEFEFGHAGRPLYIRGPSESVDEARVIAARVHALGGEYTVPLRPSETPPELALLTEAEELDADADGDRKNMGRGERFLDALQRVEWIKKWGGKKRAP